MAAGRYKRGAAVLLAVLTFPLSARAQAVTGEDVRTAMATAIQWLQRTQRADGRWADVSQEGGSTALATLALLNAGVSPQDEAMQRAIEATRRIDLKQTYTVSLKIQALAAADPGRYRKEIQDAARWLSSAQARNGMWGYDARPGHTDFSNSQFALLGLHEAARAGAEVHDRVWRAAERSWVQSQLADGGWSYTPRGSATGSMTTAGLASLYITGNTLSMRRRPGASPEGRVICCGQYTEYKPIARGLDWLAENFSVQENPGRGGWYYYYMYGLERVGILSGLRFIGDHDWYREGAAQLIRQQRPDGRWESYSGIVDTAFGLLFLAKGHKPVLFHKLAWSADRRWNLTHNDLNTLVSFIGNRLGDPPSWELATLDEPAESWLTAPILYFNGNDFPRLDPEHVEKLKAFIAQGGTLLAVASCTGEKFREGFTRFAREAFPEYPLHRVDPEHPVFRTVFKVDAKAFELWAMDIGCRTSVFFSPHDLACLWEHPNIPGKSVPALELGTNLAAYATGMEPLPDKLDVVRLAANRGDEPLPTPPRGALHIGQLMHNGDWRPDAHVIRNLAAYLHEQMGVDVVPRYQALRAGDEVMTQHPILFMTGHFSFELAADEIAALRAHLLRGGFLLAEACCGRQAFDASFRKLATALFPDVPLKPLPPTHPVIAGAPGIPLPEVKYRPAVVAEQPSLKHVRLEGIEADGRTVVIYSPYGIGCGIDGHACFACRGLVPDDAKRLAGNIILYALSY